MKLAFTRENVVICCMCRWQFLAPTTRDNKEGVEEPIPVQEVMDKLEIKLLEHLRLVHDRHPFLVTRGEASWVKDGERFPRNEYYGPRWSKW